MSKAKLAAEFWYKCPNCETPFRYTPINPEDYVPGHCGHICGQSGCSTVMEWDEPTDTGQPEPCAHPPPVKRCSMVGKIGFAILAFVLGSFLVSRIGWHRAQIGYDGAVAWAQDSSPVAGDATQDDSGGDAIATEPDKERCGPQADVRGPWCGSIDDNQLGSGTISLAIKQDLCTGRLSGRWTDDLGASGTLKGETQGEAVIVTLRPRGTRCRFAVNGTLVSPNEITGNFSIFGCKRSDGGTFDITRPSC